MKKVLTQTFVYLFLFFGNWFFLSQINWIKIFRIEAIISKIEKELGELLFISLLESEKKIEDKYILESLDSISNKICHANKIDKVEIHIFDNKEINAFALPNRHLIIYSGLILNCDNQEELIGVICHEIAHIEMKHTTKKLIKEIGIAFLISLTTGNFGGQIISDAAKLLSSRAFDRSLEKEADIKAVNYMITAKVNPESFANFFYKISEKEHQLSKYLKWINTHPDSKTRAKYILDYIKEKNSDYEPIIAKGTWNKIKNSIYNSR